MTTLNASSGPTQHQVIMMRSKFPLDVLQHLRPSSSFHLRLTRLLLLSLSGKNETEMFVKHNTFSVTI